MNGGTLRKSTTIHGQQFLSESWANRDCLTKDARYGLVEFAYVVFCAHIEATLAETISRRCRNIRWVHNWNEPQSRIINANGEYVTEDTTPLYESALSIIEAFEQKTSKSPINVLQEQFQLIFSQTLRNFLGTDLHDHLLAIGELRNLYAHGRDQVIQLSSFDYLDPIILDGTPIKNAAVLLHRRGIVSHLDVNGTNHDQLDIELHSDAAVLYFNEKTLEIESAIRANLLLLSETAIRSVGPLIKLLP